MRRQMRRLGWRRQRSDGDRGKLGMERLGWRGKREGGGEERKHQRGKDAAKGKKKTDEKQNRNTTRSTETTRRKKKKERIKPAAYLSNMFLPYVVGFFVHFWACF